MRFPFFRNRDSVKNGILISIRRTGDGFHPGLFMDYMILKEASAKWGVTPRWINYFCSGGRIPGPAKMGMVWLIPKSA